MRRGQLNRGHAIEAKGSGLVAGRDGEFLALVEEPILAGCRLNQTIQRARRGKGVEVVLRNHAKRAKWLQCFDHGRIADQILVVVDNQIGGRGLALQQESTADWAAKPVAEKAPEVSVSVGTARISGAIEVLQRGIIRGVWRVVVERGGRDALD